MYEDWDRDKTHKLICRGRFAPKNIFWLACLERGVRVLERHDVLGFLQDLVIGRHWCPKTKQCITQEKATRNFMFYV